MKLRKPLAALLAAATMAALAVTSSAVAQAADATATVDLNVMTGAVKHGATGFLYGPAVDGVPTDTTMAGIAPMDLMVAKAPHGVQHPNGDVLDVTEQYKRNGGNDIQIYMKDYYPNFPYVAYNGTMESDYVPVIQSMVTEVLTKFSQYADSFVWVPFNESDINDLNYGRKDNNGGFSDSEWKTFLNDWDIAYRTINDTYREVLGESAVARIAGPNLANYNDDLYRKFFTHAKNSQTVPQVVTWHELPQNGDKSGFYKHYDAWTKAEDEILGEDSDILVSINEYAWKDESGKAIEQVQPGSLVQYIARFENTKVQGALPYWYPAGDLDWLTTHNNQVTGSWWLYHWYGAMNGQTVQVTLPNKDQKTQVLASYEEETGQTELLFGGGTGNSMDATIVINGMAEKYPNGAHATVYGVDATAPGSGSSEVPAASDGPKVVGEYDIDTTSGTANLGFTGLNPDSAYYAIITPATAETPVFADAVEAEYARVNDSVINYGETDEYQGVGYVSAAAENTEASTDFFITSAKDGYYDLRLRYSAPRSAGSAQSREVVFKINREDTITLQLPQTADANTWNIATVRVYLPLGINQVTVSGYGTSGVFIDSLGFGQASDSETVRYEAEKAVRGGSANVVDLSSASGGQIVGNVGNGAANTLTFDTVTAEIDGDYTLTIAYSQNEFSGGNAFQTVERWADLTVNGEPLDNRLVFANTRDWNDYWTTSFRIHLKQGENTLAFGNASGWAPNFDYIQVAPTVAETHYRNADGQDIVPIETLTPEAEGLTQDEAGNYVLNLDEGGSSDIKIDIYPVTSTDAALTWTSSDSSVVTVDAGEAGRSKARALQLVDTATIRAVSTGTATVTAAPSTNPSNQVVTITVNVKDEDAPTPGVDKSKLEAAVDAAGKLDESAYKADSWKAFAEALDSAKGVLRNDDATQAEVDAAVELLTDAQSKLVKGDQEEGGDNADQDSDGNGSSNGDTTDGSSSDKDDTGDAGKAPKRLSSTGSAIAVVAAVAGVLVLAAGGLLIVRHRRAKR